MAQTSEPPIMVPADPPPDYTGADLGSLEDMGIIDPTPGPSPTPPPPPVTDFEVTPAADPEPLATDPVA